MADDLVRYAYDPVGFLTDVLGDAGTPYSKQAAMLEALVAHRRVSVVGANGSGKDWTAARAVLWWLAARSESKAVVMGPTQRQVQEIVWQEMRAAHAAAADRLGGRMYAAKYCIDEHRFAIGFSTNDVNNIQGFHSPELLVVVTEAHAMPQAYMDAIKRLQPNRLLLVGNAMSREGEFYDSHHAKRHLYHRMAISAFDTPNFTGEDGGRSGMITPEDVEELAADWGEEHPLYASSVLAQFPDTLEDSLFSRADVESAMERWQAEPVVPGEAGTLSPNEPVYMGVDVARFGFDKSVLCVRQGQRVLAVRSLGRVDTMRLVYEVMSTAGEMGASAIFVDEGGVGGGVVDRLRELGAPVYGVQFGGAAQRAARFFNRRSEIFWELRMLFSRRLIAIPRDEELAGQLLALRYDVSSSGQVQLEGKRALRRRGMPSPDKADALALAFLAPPSFGIWTGAEPFLIDDREDDIPHLLGFDHAATPPFAEPAAHSSSDLRVWW